MKLKFIPKKNIWDLIYGKRRIFDAEAWNGKKERGNAEKRTDRTSGKRNPGSEWLYVDSVRAVETGAVEHIGEINK